jgi:hypothetical protein
VATYVVDADGTVRYEHGPREPRSDGSSDPVDGAWRGSAPRLATTAEQTRFYAAAG